MRIREAVPDGLGAKLPHMSSIYEYIGLLIFVV